VRLEQALDATAGPVVGDPNRLEQVVGNLLSNAIKFTPKGGEARVLLERVGSNVEIHVLDTGSGIEAEFLPRVFDRFLQADASSTRRHGGLGLGLAIVKQLVEMHGGTVAAASAGKGRGAAFSVRLPAAGAERPVSAGSGARDGPVQSAEEVAMPDLSGIRVLDVDDEDDARDVVRRVLEACGAKVICAANAEEGLCAAARDRPHVLVSDIAMPGINGIEFLRRVHELGPGHGGGVPAIALTAFARSEDRAESLAAGYVSHLAKPAEPSELLATVAGLVGRDAGKRAAAPPSNFG
jgi:CheY-like chemotaxis protein